MLSQVNDLVSEEPALVSVRLIKVDRHEFVADLGCKLAVIHLAVGRHVFEHIEFVNALAQLLLVVILAIVLLALVLGPLLPAILVEAVGEHEDELHNLVVVSFVHHLTAVSQVQHKDLVRGQHIPLRLREHLNL